MTESDEFLRAAIVAGRTVKRLELAGHTFDEAKRLVLAVINAEERKAGGDGYFFDATCFVKRLEQLPEEG